MNYEQIIEKLKGVKLTMGGMIKLQRAVGPKAAVLNKSEADIAKMTPEESADHQLNMLEVLSTLIYIAIGSPKDETPDSIADLIPFDNIDEISNLVGDIMGSVEKTRKN